MLKVRLMGTVDEIKWFSNLLLGHKELKVLEISSLYENRGISKYYRAYAEVEKVNEE